MRRGAAAPGLPLARILRGSPAVSCFFRTYDTLECEMVNRTRAALAMVNAHSPLSVQRRLSHIKQTPTPTQTPSNSASLNPNSASLNPQQLSTEVQALKEELQEMKSHVKEMHVEVKSMKAKRHALEAFLRNPKDCPIDVDKQAFQDCQTMSVTELKQDIRDKERRIDVKEQDIRDKEHRIDVKEQDIRDKERKMDELIREIAQKETQFTYAKALHQNAKAVMRFPITQTETRAGRKGFDTHLADIFSSFATMEMMNKQNSAAVVLQCASGVGKTFACNTFRRGQLNMNPSVKYVPIGVYLGLNQGFELTQDETKAIKEHPSAIQPVLFQRLVFCVNGIIEEVNRHRDAPDPFARALDDAAGAWVQRFPFPDGDYRYRVIESTNNVACIVELLKALRDVAMKRLAILVCVDEGQELDRLTPGQEEGGARIALRELRWLQQEVFNQTKGEVILLPITTGINAKVSLGDETNGKNIVFGADDEALMTYKDFTSLLRAELSEEEASLDGRFVNMLAAAHYPHVRSMLSSPKNPECKSTDDIDHEESAMKIVIAAFMKRSINLRHCSFPVGRIPLRLNSEERGVPVLSFLYWGQIHNSLLSQSRVTIPIDKVNVTWFHHSKDWASFESRCFYILRYFFAIFGPMDKVLLYPKRTEGWVGLCGPLRNWLPAIKFQVTCVTKEIDTGGVLDNETEQYNPFTCPKWKGHKNMALYPLTQQFKALVNCAVLNAKPLMAEAVWVKCGGSAPIDYILVVFEVSNKDKLTVHLRFADAKHTSKSKKKSKDNTYHDALEKPTKPQDTEEELYKKLFRKMNIKAKHLHKLLSFRIKELRCEKRTIVVMPFDEKTSFMLCHNTKNEFMFSPSTFEWRPWSSFLFCGSDIDM